MSQPQNESASSGITESSQKQIEDMKQFMAKDAIELASGLKEKPFTYDAVPVRGRLMVVPKAPAARAIPATMMSCLYALCDPRIDEILRAVGAQAHFIGMTGDIETQPVIRNIDVVVTVGGINPAEPEKHQRNILIDEEVKPWEQKPGQMVAVFNENGTIFSVGTIWAWNTRQDPVSHIVKTFHGHQLEVAESLLQKIDSMEEFATFCSKVRQQ